MNRTNESLYALAYFRQVYGGRVEISEAGETQMVTLTDKPLRVESLHLAWSGDGRHWSALNQNRPWVPSVWLRDPFVNRGPDGWFHLLATGGDGSRDCLYMRSPDLIQWEPPRSLPVMASVPQANNVWAPEWFFDEAQSDYLLLWSSSFENAGWKKSRLWACRTPDFQSFSEPYVLFAPPYSVIDGTLVLQGGTYFLFHKEEEFGALRGERRAIRFATASQIEGPYTVFDGPLNPSETGGQIVPTITEGPSVMPDPLQAGWILVYDFCMGNDYGVSSSPDLWHWREEISVSFPANARHGSVFAISPQELMQLQAQTGRR
jgi:hypothetical protein